MAQNEGELFKVIRWCCTSGNCFHCLDAPYHPRKDDNRPTLARRDKRREVVQMDKLQRAKAETVAANWAGYGARVAGQDEALQYPLPAFRWRCNMAGARW